MAQEALSPAGARGAASRPWPSTGSSLATPPSRRHSYDELDGWSSPGTPATKGPQDELEDWVARMWTRMDRDHSGTLTRAELNCEAFHSVIRLAIAPVTGASTGGATYTRSEMNMKEAIQFCVRKADGNSDGTLSFEEFRLLMLALRDPYLGQHKGLLAFTLFDTDTSLTMDKLEFREVMRFFLGRNPTAVEFQEEWGRLASQGEAESVTQQQYIKWLQTTPNPAYQQHAPPSAGAGEGAAAAPGAAAALLAPGGQSEARDLRARPRWNKRFNASVNPLHINDSRPQGTREYFSNSQSMPELQRFYSTYPDNFKAHAKRLATPEPARTTCTLFPKSLSSEGGTPLTLPGRHGPAGQMRSHSTGRAEPWDDHWTYPLRLRTRFRAADRPFAPQALFGELTDSFALSREGLGTKPEPRASRPDLKVPGGRVLGSSGPRPERHRVRPARPTTLTAEPW